MKADDRRGTITRDGAEAALEFERYLPYPMEAVWAALTEPDQRARWFGVTVIDGRPGGHIETIADGPPVPEGLRRVRGRILVWDPPRVLEHEWHQTLIGETIVRYELSPDGEGTRLRLTHRHLSQRNAEGFIPGTHAYLDRLEAVLASGEIPDWGQRYAEVKSDYA